MAVGPAPKDRTFTDRAFPTPKPHGTDGVTSDTMGTPGKTRK